MIIDMTTVIASSEGDREGPHSPTIRFKCGRWVGPFVFIETLAAFRQEVDVTFLLILVSICALAGITLYLFEMAAERRGDDYIDDWEDEV